MVAGDDDDDREDAEATGGRWDEPRGNSDNVSRIRLTRHISRLAKTIGEKRETARTRAKWF
jgi:hypothetical protein